MKTMDVSETIDACDLKIGSRVPTEIQNSMIIP